MTSKRQVTLPVKAARSLGIEQGSQLYYRVDRGRLILEPSPTIGERFAGIWPANARANRGAATDASIKQTLRKYHRANRSRP